MKKTLLRLINTRTLCNQLPEVFTKSQYEELRLQQARDLRKQWEQETGEHYRLTTSFSRGEGAFTLEHLIDEGFAIQVGAETFTKIIRVWETGKIYSNRPIEAKCYYYRLTKEIFDFFEKLPNS